MLSCCLPCPLCHNRFLHSSLCYRWILLKKDLKLLIYDRIFCSSCLTVSKLLLGLTLKLRILDLNTDDRSQALTDIIYCEGEKDGVSVEVALQHNDSYTENTYGFVNNINTPEGGTHITGFRNAITNTFNDYARKNKLLKDSEPNLSGDDIREGLTAIVSVKIENPQFEGQTKQKLGNSEARGAVALATAGFCSRKISSCLLTTLSTAPLASLFPSFCLV